MKRIKIRYFALLREKAKKAEEELDCALENYHELYEELSLRYEFNLPVEMIQLAVNDEFQNPATPIRQGDSVVFIPPVAGG
jgi:molybdopterin converting factor subunit 1